MPDIVGRLLSGFFGVMLALFVPVVLITLKADQTIQVNVNDAVNEFTSNAKATGMITSAGYEKMVSRLDNTGILYEITLSHTHTTVQPKVADNGSIERGKIVYAQDAFYGPEIYAVLFPEIPSTEITKYYMNKGDEFQVTVHNTTPTMGGRYLSMIVPFYTGNSIFTVSSECIGNEQEDN